MAETQTMTLVEFLEARLAEDEAAAREARPDEYLSSRDNSDAAHVRLNGYSTCAITSGRLLREVEAKRAILAMHADQGDLGWVLLTLAAVYADHPDYRDDWRP